MARRRIPPRDLQLARDASVLLNEAFERLTIPRHIHRLAATSRTRGVISEWYENCLKRTATLSVVLGVCRLHEIREYYLLPLLGADVVTTLGIPHIPSFVGDWGAFREIRNAWAVQATANDPRRPASRSGWTAMAGVNRSLLSWVSGRDKESRVRRGRWLDPYYFGQLTERCGMTNEALFLDRVETLVPAVERARDYLLAMFPGTREYIAQCPEQMARGAEAVKRNRARS